MAFPLNTDPWRDSKGNITDMGNELLSPPYPLEKLRRNLLDHRAKITALIESIENLQGEA